MRPTNSMKRIEKAKMDLQTAGAIFFAVATLIILLFGINTGEPEEKTLPVSIRSNATASEYKRQEATANEVQSNDLSAIRY